MPNKGFSDTVSQLAYKLEQKIKVERQNLEKDCLEPAQTQKLNDFILWQALLENAKIASYYGVIIDEEKINNLKIEISAKYPGERFDNIDIFISQTINELRAPAQKAIADSEMIFNLKNDLTLLNLILSQIILNNGALLHTEKETLIILHEKYEDPVATQVVPKAVEVSIKILENIQPSFDEVNASVKILGSAQLAYDSENDSD